MTTDNTASEILIKNQIPSVELEDDRHPRYLEHKEKIIKLYQAGAITQAQITAIVALAPHLADLARSVAETAAKSQNAVLDVHLELARSALSVQEKIILEQITSMSDETLEKISNNILSMNKSNNETQERLNQSNNSLFEKLTIGVVGAAVGAVAGIFLSKK